jgi:hypothetical protein
LSVPCHAKAIDVEEAITGCDLCFGSGLCMYGWVVREEFGKIVVVDLLGKRMCGFWNCQ